MAPHDWVHFLASFGLCAIVVALWTELLDRFSRSSPRGREALLGAMMGAGAVMAMTVPVEMMPGLQFDLRSSMVALAGLFGGPVAALLAAAPAVAFRGHLGGAGALAGCAAILFAAGAGCLWHRTRHRRTASYRDLAGLAIAAASGNLLAFTLLPRTAWIDVVPAIGLPLFAATVSSTLLLGSAFLTMQRRKELAGTNAVFQAMVSALPDCLNVKDLDGRFLAANPATARLMGAFTADDLVGKSDFDFYAPELARRYRADELAFLAEGRPLVTDQPAEPDRDSERWLATLKAPFFDERGRLIGMITHNRDITDRKRAELDLVDARDEALRANRAKSEFLAAMSHEIRTPMTGVLGMADLLAAESLSPTQARYVETIRTSGRHLLNIINDILDFSRIEAGKLELERVDFSVQDILEEVRSLMAPQAAERGLDLAFRLEGPAPLVVRGDPTRLRQVLVNLVGNGLKFTARGRVAVAVRRRPATDDATLLRFEVRDTGTGIPRQRHAELFEAFVQADSSTTRHYGGSGLGLAICRRLVEAMAGEIGVESEPGRGSTFWFEIAFERGDARAAAQRSALEPADVRPLRVLVADDVPANRELLEAMLGHYGHETMFAADGSEALAFATKERFDVVLMDVQMPVMDGMEATRRIRRLPPPHGAVPIFALTANVMASERARYLAAGMNQYLTKPVIWPDLFAALAAVTAGSRPARTEEHRAPPPPAATATESEVAGTPLLDHSLLDGMARELPPAVLQKLLARAIDGAGESCDRLQGALADPEALAREAHRLRGTSGTFGLARIATLAGSIEDRAERGEDVADLTAALERAVAASREALQQHELVA